MEVAGRGELQLGILIETMRREGFELSVSRPKVLFRRNDHGELLEPIEEVVIDLDAEHSGIVVQKLSERKGELLEMRPSGGGRQRLVFYVPTRGLIGYQSELLTDTRGTGIMNRLFHAYAPYKGEAKWLTDLAVGYRFSENVKLTVGGNNIFDVYPTKWDETDGFPFRQLGFTYGWETTPFGFNGGSYYLKLDWRF